MATFFTKPPVGLIERMAANQDDLDWLATANFAESANGYWIAWQSSDLGHLAYLAPGDSQTRAKWLDCWEPLTQAEMIDYFESGEIETDPPGELNLMYRDDETGEWK